MSTAARRNGASAKPAPSPDSSPSTSKQANPTMLPTAPSPYFLLVYPIILILGSSFSVLSPVARPGYQQATAMTPGLSSDLSTPTSATTPINYFASKHNVLNVYFVKILWFWTTLSFALIFLSTYLPFQSQTQQQRTSKSRPYPLLQSLLRYALTTVSWIFVTQWFFGPPFIDRSFTLTGGSCDLPLTTHSNLSPTEKFATSSSSTYCKRTGGSWTGGHDISGHVFLLVLSTCFLTMELYLSSVYLSSTSSSASSHPHISAQAAEQIAASTSEDEKKAMGGWEQPSTTETQLRLWVRRLAWTVIGMGGWMLLMTAVWFHSLGEKLSGLGLAAGVLWTLYWAPGVSRSWRGIIGGV